ncbi:molybdopterin-guanine dinucleotide biosynthesis protein B [Lutispora sp.]|uniref:molybdopterin-guanine dinucleotide biosynthesis protein B n=1 Tax=Lutispora sp. TaxID=2828727 RepID=UPI000ECB408C|nr:molybdopterin-guanine dinucleotide biosynthesis protein B [Lutispora sp.]MEA4960990.1 molybdopterin-guanine dinucleotide biosynthesis protein B [Lutispora sp.]HCJ57642.1 molybdopterin-guanine dinucleotide biosynthesis protein B [Clostridiaceae bacterium]
MKVISVYGYSKSGKTTTVERLIKELIKRNYTVGSVKEIHYEEFAIDMEGSNTDRHRKAGAGPVTARGLYETDILFKKRLPMPEILKFYDQDFVILEGVTDFGVPKILCASSIEDVMERIHPSVFVLSGVISNKISRFKSLSVINAVTDIERLTDLVESTAMDWESV